MLALWLTLLTPTYARAAASCTAPSRRQVLERSEDFFRLRRRAEERERIRDVGRDEIRGRARERDEKLEAARREYIRTRRPKPDDAAGEAEWRATLAARQRRIEDARECFTDRRGEEHIPGALNPEVEYGLDE